MQKLLRLRDELNFPYAASSQFYVALQFTGLDHLVLNAVLYGRDFVKDGLTDGSWISERLDHLQEFRCQSFITFAARRAPSTSRAASVNRSVRVVRMAAP